MVLRTEPSFRSSDFALLKRRKEREKSGAKSARRQLNAIERQRACREREQDFDREPRQRSASRFSSQTLPKQLRPAEWIGRPSGVEPRSCSNRGPRAAKGWLS